MGPSPPCTAEKKKEEKKEFILSRFLKSGLRRALPLPRLRRDLPVAEVLPEQPRSLPAYDCLLLQFLLKINNYTWGLGKWLSDWEH